VIAKMERETGLNANACGHIFYPSIVGGDIYYRAEIFHDIDDVENYISADEYLTGIRESFTLGDLEETMIVELRNKDRLIYFGGVLSTFVWSGGTFVTSGMYMKLNRINNDFTNKNNEKFDIMKIYKPKSCTNINMNLLKSDSNLVLIFDAEAHRRNKYKILQRKSEIKNEMAKLQEELDLLEVK
jgi:hypothetical protein